MIRQFLGLLCFCVALIGCTTTARFYPVEGPLVESKLTSPLKATVYGILGNNGDIKMRNSEGLMCEGEWSSTSGQTVTINQGSLVGQYGPTYFGSSISSGGGQNPGQAILLCPDGNQIAVEFFTGGGTASGFGIAKDKKGNIFRVLF